MTRAGITVVVKIGDRELSRQQVSVRDGQTVVLEVDVASAVAVLPVSKTASFRATLGVGEERQKKKEQE